MRIQRLKTKAFNFIEQVTDVYLVTRYMNVIRDLK